VSNDRCIVIRLIPEETVSLEVKFTPREIGKYNSQVRLFIADNPYENLIIDLKSEAYAELIVLDGLELANTKPNYVNERRETNAKSRRSSKPNSTARGNQDCKKNIKTIVKNYNFNINFLNFFLCVYLIYTLLINLSETLFLFIIIYFRLFPTYIS